MSLDNLLRDYARQDLQRFCPAAHYWNRDHNPIADHELTWPLLREPVRFGLTPRERVAATALYDLTTYTIKSRAIWDAAYPVRDSDDPTPATGTTFDQEREIWGRREVSRSSALVYARMLGDVQLIEHYQTPVPAPATDTAPAQNTATPAPVVTENASAGVEPAKAVPNWSLKTSIKRAPGYRWPLYQVLKAAHTAGQPCPKARDVLDAWKQSPPSDVLVMTDGVKYNDGLGNPKEANLKAIQQAIKGLLKL